MKPKLLIFGNCQADHLMAVLDATPEVAEKFDFFHHFVKLDRADFPRLAEEAAAADVVLAQDVADWEIYPFKDRLAHNAPVIRFPFVYLASLWPFDSHQNGPDPKAFAERGCHGDREFPYHDILMARLREETADLSARFNRYQKLDISPIPNFQRYHAMEAARLRAMDDRFDMDVGEFVLENFRVRQLFHTITHPTAETMLKLAGWVAGRLGIRPAWRRYKLDERLGYFQVPVHPLVAKSLGLDWYEPELTYAFNNKERLTFEAYYKQYISVYG